MVTAYEIASQVVDPELRVVTIAELGILRDAEAVEDGRVVVTITPTYSGCPAMDVIRTEIATALRDAGYSEVEIVTRLSPPWTTDWISGAGRAKLERAGIAPPPQSSRRALPLLPEASLPCPRCGSAQTEQVSRFGSTACVALWRCRACAEPFPHVKAH